jgi:putative transposase
MSNTCSQISIQAVFAVKARENLISNTWRNMLHEYITGIVRKEATPLAVGGWHDHVYIFSDYR